MTPYFWVGVNDWWQCCQMKENTRGGGVEVRIIAKVVLARLTWGNGEEDNQGSRTSRPLDVWGWRSRRSLQTSILMWCPTVPTCQHTAKWNHHHPFEIAPVLPSGLALELCIQVSLSDEWQDMWSNILKLSMREEINKERAKGQKPHLHYRNLIQIM